MSPASVAKMGRIQASPGRQLRRDYILQSRCVSCGMRVAATLPCSIATCVWLRCARSSFDRVVRETSFDAIHTRAQAMDHALKFVLWQCIAVDASFHFQVARICFDTFASSRPLRPLNATSSVPTIDSGKP